MDKTLFEDLVASLQEAKAIAQGKAEPSRRFVVPAPDTQNESEPQTSPQQDSPGG
jgi:putative transcriptional regulator